MPADPPVSQPRTPPPQRRAAAVAIKHDGHADAPARIVAKGRGGVAEQILALAFANDVKVREDADLVEVLDAVDVDCEVPLHALAAVAEILTYLYRANTMSPPRSTDGDGHHGATAEHAE